MSVDSSEVQNNGRTHLQPQGGLSNYHSGYVMKLDNDFDLI